MIFSALLLLLYCTSVSLRVLLCVYSKRIGAEPHINKAECGSCTWPHD